MEATVMTSASSAFVPSPVAVTPQLLAQHSITADEYSRILAALGRVPEHAVGGSAGAHGGCHSQRGRGVGQNPGGDGTGREGGG